MATALDSYRTLGRSGLRISRLALGTATFGTEWGWGTERDEARRIFDTFVERGGNMIDTAATYTNGTSERLVGEFARSERERLVLATKYTTLRRTGDPNSGGSHRKNLMASVEASLRSLDTDYLDLLYLHVWDDLTPVDEILRGMDDLVRSGKLLHVGMSTAPSWQVARMQTIADLRGWTPLIALQVEYNLVERGAENDLMPMAAELGLGLVPFSPLAGGVLAGGYRRSDLDGTAAPEADGTRRAFNLALGQLRPRAFDVVEAVRAVADEIDERPAAVALAWLLRHPGVTAPIIGARTYAQLESNLRSLEVEMSAAQVARLDEASTVEPAFPHGLLGSDHLREQTRGDMSISA